MHRHQPSILVTRALRDYGTGKWEGGDADCDHLGPPIRTREKLNENAGTGRDVKNKETRAPMKDVCTKCGARRIDQQIGLEPTPDAWVDALVQVFRECRRVLRNDGCMFLEVGDTYNANQGAGFDTNQNGDRTGARAARVSGTRPASGVKPKDLVGAPWLLAFALRKDGWYLRSDIIWSRPNPMPESVTDRPTKAHSYIFLLTKSARYFYDADAIREESKRSGEIPGGNRQGVSEYKVNGGYAHGVVPAMANARSVWSIPTEPTPFAHFATFPQALVERCIKAGTSEHGCCRKCGKPWFRRIERTGADNKSNEVVPDYDVPGLAKGTSHDRVRRLDGKNYQHMRAATNEWAAGCMCFDGAAVPCVVLDPFMGSATTALVARRLGRHAVGVELNEEYLKIAATRLQQLSLLG